MAQKKSPSETAKTPGPSGAEETPQRRWLLPAALVALVAVGGLMAYLLFEDKPVVVGNTPRARTLAQRTFLPAQGRDPRPASLDPTRFTDPEVHRAYQIAHETPELLEQMPCYCGCYATSGHASNYDCFVDNHGAT